MPKNGYANLEDKKKGSGLSTDYDYFKNSHDCIFEIAVKLAHVLWRKMLPDQREAADSNLMNVGYELLVEKKYKLAQTIFAFAVDVLKNYFSQEQRLMFVLNYAQSHKWSGDDKICNKLIKSQDWSATKDSLRLGQQVLLENFADARATMLRIGKSGDISKENYKEWPIFQAFRKTREFREAFEELFGVFEQPPMASKDTNKSELTNKLHAISKLDDLFAIVADCYTGAIAPENFNERLKEIKEPSEVTPPEADYLKSEPPQSKEPESEPLLQDDGKAGDTAIAGTN